VREGIVKHETEYDVSSAEQFEPNRRGLLEAQIANAADEIAYNAHDLDDGLRAGLFLPQDMDGLELWETLKHSVGWDGAGFDDLWRHRLIRRLIGLEVTDVVTTTAQRLQDARVGSVDDLRALDHNLIGFSDEMLGRNRQHKGFLYRRMYQHHRVLRMHVKAERVLQQLFEAYAEEPRQMPESTQARIDQVGLQRAVCDYIAGMTDSFALDEHQKLFDPATRV
jgi:dGTPase